MTHRRNTSAMHDANRCGVRTRGGSPCKSPAIKGRSRCRMHGGHGSGAPKGNRNAWKHGGHSAEVLALARDAMEFLRVATSGLDLIADYDAMLASMTALDLTNRK